MGVPGAKYEDALNVAIERTDRALTYSVNQAQFGFPVNTEADRQALKEALDLLRSLIIPSVDPRGAKQRNGRMGARCQMCRAGEKDWVGADPVCGFSDGWENNWNCGTLNALRYFCDGSLFALPAGVDYHCCNDQKYATLNLSDIDWPGDAPLALWVTWYKRRGHTDAVWLLFETGPPRSPTEEELLRIIEHYENVSNLNHARGRN